MFITSFKIKAISESPEIPKSPVAFGIRKLKKKYRIQRQSARNLEKQKKLFRSEQTQ
jgi:hypothetical protein